MSPTFCLLQQHENYARMIRRMGGCVEYAGNVLVVRRGGIGWCAQAAHIGVKPVGLSLPFTRQHAVLDLTPSLAALRSGLAQKWRNRLNASERLGLDCDVAEFRGDPEHWLLKKDHQQASRKRYRNWPAAMTCAFSQTKGAARIYVARAKSEPVAAIMVLVHGPSATYHIGWRNPALSGSHNLLIWRAICDLKQRGITAFDLGCLPNDAQGLRHFKLGTGAVPTPIETRIGWFRGYSPIIHSPSGQNA